MREDKQFLCKDCYSCSVLSSPGEPERFACLLYFWEVDGNLKPCENFHPASKDDNILVRAMRGDGRE